MSSKARLASKLFRTEAVRGTKKASSIVLEETRRSLESLDGIGLDLLVLCEGIEAYQNLDEAESLDEGGLFMELYRAFAVRNQCVVAGSVKTKQNEKIYNSVVFWNKAGQIAGCYNKSNLTFCEHEQGLSSGDEAVVVETEIGRVGAVVCYDLNFEWLRKEYKRLKPDLLVFPSMFHGGLIQQFWAYDCRCYMVCSCQFQDSGILDPFGRTVAATNCYEDVAIADVDMDYVMVHLDYNREKFEAIRKKYPDNVKIDVPANIGSAMITCSKDGMGAMDVVREFELELLDDYFLRAYRMNMQKK